MDFSFVKKHPVGVGGAVLVGGLVLYMLLHHSVAAASTVSASGTTPAQDQQALIVQQANAALAIQQQAHQAQFADLNLQATTQQNLATLAAYQNITLGTQANNVQSLQITKQSDVQSQAISAQLAQASLQSDNALTAATTTSNNQTQVQLAGIGAGAQMQQNQLQAAVDQTKTLASLQGHITDTNAAMEQNITQLNTQAQVAITQINANTQQGIANTSAGVQKNSSNNSSWVQTAGTIATVAAMFMCDINLKGKKGCVSIAGCLDAVKTIPLDKFVYLFNTAPYNSGDTHEHVNTYSQDFYKAIGVSDYAERKQIDPIDMMGVLCGAIRALEMRHA